ncbi:hypothetical protein E2C01_101391 [Portunus trituberculatus]|uniref:Uncharacterized protein n=1 Tax=Portunus trituberculatus TaxID=210409 RepID=A0A5B7KFZ9_PORTR|nr:hypothetical protein [Portunus trituberculatus]
MPPYGAQFRDFFKQSESSDFQTLGERVKIVSTTGEGLQQATINNKLRTIRLYVVVSIPPILRQVLRGHVSSAEC